jgi:hypothetical protein
MNNYKLDDGRGEEQIIWTPPLAAYLKKKIVKKEVNVTNINNPN